MPINTIIIDDEPKWRNVLTSLCKESRHPVEVLDTCESLEEALKSIDKYQPDLLLLDIELTDGLGFEILDVFEKPRFKTVFVSAFDHYALKAVKYHALDYLLKPVDEEEFGNMMDVVVDRKPEEMASDLRKLSEYLKAETNLKIGVPTTYGVHYYHLDEIVRLESDASYTILFLKSGEQVVICKNLKEFERSLAKQNFLRVHRKHLVNMEWARGFNRDEGGYLVMKNGDKVPVARSLKEQVVFTLKENAIGL